jgi:NAD(P)-dependent dehydrogenase (short-subunit alcohol dehydrogenase family)
MEGLTGKHVVVVGGTSGIGRAIAKQAAAAGADLRGPETAIRGRAKALRSAVDILPAL